MVRAPACHAGGHGFEPHLSRLFGSLAQLGERLPYKQDVTGSSPVIPIKDFDLIKVFFLCYALARQIPLLYRGSKIALALRK